MRYEWHPGKRIQNLSRHGLDFEPIELFDWENAVEFEDHRFKYGETRLIAIGYFLSRLTLVVYTVRNGNRRIISWRKANRREVERYG